MTIHFAFEAAAFEAQEGIFGNVGWQNKMGMGGIRVQNKVIFILK